MEFNRAKTLEAIGALREFTDKQKKDTKASLLEAAECVYLTISLKLVPESGFKKATPIILPHSILQDVEKGCIVVSHRHKEAVKACQLKGELPNIGRILTPKSLKEKYYSFEQKRQLARSYSMFIVERSKMIKITRLMGSSFTKAKKFPVPFEYKKSNIPKLDKIAQSTSIPPVQGQTVSVKIANMEMSNDHIADNVESFYNQLSRIPSPFVDKTKNNVTGIFIKTASSPALPISFASVDVSGAELKKDSEKDKANKTLEAGISTILAAVPRREPRVQEKQKAGKRKGKKTVIRKKAKGVGKK